jgi:hypothetical protein
MDRTLSALPRLGPTPRPWQRLRDALGAAWHRLTLDPDERWLRGARDLVDLELRLKALERGGALPTPYPDVWR